MYKFLNFQVTRIILFLILIITSIASHANFSTKIIDGKLNIVAKLKKNEKIYWNIPGKFGYPTTIKLLNSKNLERYDIKWPKPILHKTDETLNAYLKGEVQIEIQTIPKNKNEDISLQLGIEYILCKVDGCYPNKETIDIKTNLNNDPIENYSTNILSKNISNNILSLNLETNIENPDYIIITDSGDIIDYATATYNNESYSVNFNLKNYNSYPHLKLLDQNLKTEIEFDLPKNAQQNYNLAIYFLFAFIGGFILNFMPCVLPVLSLKLYSLYDSQSISERRWECLLTSVTIFIYFSFLALVTIIFKKAGKLFIPGFSLQIPELILAYLGIIIILISLLRDKITFNIDVSFIEKYGKTGKNLKIISTSLISTILATPCTAPFLVTSMSFAATQETQVILSIFSFASIGFAFPYIILTIFPKTILILPKSGKWQNYLKTIFVVMLFGTIIWLLYIILGQLGVYATFSSFALIYIIRFIAEREFKSNRSKILSLALLFSLLLYIPVNVSKNFDDLSQYYEKSWQEFTNLKLEDNINKNNLVIVSVTADWCVICKINKFRVLDTINTVEFLRKYDTIKLYADLTVENTEVTNYMTINNFVGVPHTIIYGPKAKEGIILPVIFNFEDIQDAILKAK